MSRCSRSCPRRPPSRSTRRRPPCATLPPLIPELRDYRVGPDLGIDPGNATFVVIGDFDDEDGYRTYRDHPEHVAVAREHILPILAAAGGPVRHLERRPGAAYSGA